MSLSSKRLSSRALCRHDKGDGDRTPAKGNEKGWNRLRPFCVCGMQYILMGVFAGGWAASRPTRKTWTRMAGGPVCGSSREISEPKPGTRWMPGLHEEATRNNPGLTLIQHFIILKYDDRDRRPWNTRKPWRYGGLHLLHCLLQPIYFDAGSSGSRANQFLLKNATTSSSAGQKDRWVAIWEDVYTEDCIVS
ncbi:hypothetical protein GGX14DRAFT_440285 [Mycena pura]|uniref:Uncharacterized protein n=1 Tax=Mycena pura TaxID=153505 RepID=A0AAD6VQY5_9AGAR|nr:hypothetical protein GGX14DRAFT_440285 [Mycena pura]